MAAPLDPPAPAQEVEASDPLDALTEKERAFVVAYCGSAHGNGVEAARAAGYEGTYDTLCTQAWRMLRKAEIRSAIKEQFAPRIPEAEQILGILEKQAAGNMALFSDCWQTEQWQDEDGETIVRRTLDWDRINAKGLGPLIKEVSSNRYGDTLKLYSATEAAALLGKYRALFTERIRVDADLDLSKLTREQLQAIAEGRQGA